MDCRLRDAGLLAPRPSTAKLLTGGAVCRTLAFSARKWMRETSRRVITRISIDGCRGVVDAFLGKAVGIEKHSSEKLRT